MLEGGKAAVRDGKETRFWTTCWVDAGLKLIDFVDPTIQGVDLESPVADFTTTEGNWNFDLLENLLPPEAVDILAGMSPPQEGRGEDDWVWGCEKSGLFTIISAYALIGRIETSAESERWKAIWKWRGPSRIRFFLWLAAKDRILTNAARQKRGLSQDASCPRCAAAIEDSCHVLRDCPFAGETWKRAIGFDINGAVWQSSYIEWLMHFLKSDEWLKRDWEVKLSHVYREANHAADHLASRGHTVTRGCHLIDPTDGSLAYFIRYDCMGISKTRLIN
ncbi:Putative ribonuclease H protein At1g65750 [Linum perenne]